MGRGGSRAGGSPVGAGASEGGSAPPASNAEAGSSFTSLPAAETKPIRAKKRRLHKAATPLGPTADADCYTCRRRRVRCDRGLPTCRKCAKAEHECAGYKKGFRWVGGIASRGKMMGKRTFDEEEDVEDEDGGVNGRSEKEEGSYTILPVRVGGGGGVAVMRESPHAEMAVSEEDVSQSEDMAMGVLMMDSPQMTMPLAENYSYVTSIAIPALYSPVGIELSPLDFAGIDFFTESPAVTEDTVSEEPQEASDSDINSLPLVTTSGGSSLGSYIATTATQWSQYFDTSSNYSYSRARSGRYYRIAPNGVDVYGKQYTLSLCVEPPATTCLSGSSSSEFDISIASLVDFYVSTPAAAPSMIGCLDATARHYLSYFDQMCGIFLLFDRHPLNPYRELLLSTLHFYEPALLSTILAVAARYHANVTGHYYNSSHDRPDLIYYNQALSFLNQDLQDEDRMLEDTTLASVLFFLFYETMDSGLDTWRVHLSGARKLVELKYGKMQMQQGKGLTHMQAFILHSIALFDIIGSTLVTDRQPSVLPSLCPLRSSLSPSIPTTPTSIPTALTHLDTTVLPILIQGEIFCFLACPPTLLHLILKTTLLSSHPYLSTPSPPPHLFAEFHPLRTLLLNQIISFDPTPWLHKHNSQSTITADKDDLLHHVEAYKTAVLIYLYRSLYLPHELLGEVEGEGNADMQQLAERLFFHLDQIPTRGPLYKGTVWPCFIAGTEARNRVQKGRVRKHFGRLWEVLYCENVRNGMCVLEELWGEKGGVVEEYGEEGEEGAEGGEMGREELGVEGSGRGRGRAIGAGTSMSHRRGGAAGSMGKSSSSTSTSTPRGGQDWKGYLKRKGVEWLFI